MAIAPSPPLAPPRPARCTSKLYLMHPGEAATWIAEGLYARQRPLRPFHVAFLQHLMTIDRFRDGTPIDLAQSGQKRMVINGQHTLHAIVASQRSQWVVLTIHRTQSLDDVAHLYSTFDRQMPRNTRDMLKAYGFPDASGLNARQSDMLLGCMRLVLSGFVYPMPTSDTRLGYLRDQELLYVAAMQWQVEAKQFCTAISGTQSTWSKYLLRQPLMAVALVQFRSKPVQALDFWTWVAHESHVSPTHPTRLLARWLQREGIRGNYDRGEYVRTCASAWNAYLDDTPIKQLHALPRGRPLHLAGTPHTLSTVRRYLSPTWELLREPVPYAEPLYGNP